MCINGDESEPATFNNRLLIERDPHQFLEGIAIACYATRATTATSTSDSSTSTATESWRRRSPRARAAGHLGKNIYGSGFDLDVWGPATAAQAPISAAKRPD